MKTLILVIINCALVNSLCYSQHSTYQIILNGKITDSTNGHTINRANIIVKDSLGYIIEKYQTDSMGIFSIKLNIGPAKEIKFSREGYKSITVDLNRTFLGNNSFSLINLVPEFHILKDVTIVSNKKIYQQEIDRIIYNVQADSSANGENGFDIIKRAPFITLNEQDKVQIKGSGNYKVLLDGKPSSLLTTNLKDVLRGMSFNQISRIEIITTPPAKYDAEGLSGLINIITTKHIGDGYNGSIGGSYSNLYQGLSTSINLKIGKIGGSLMIGKTWETSPQSIRNTNYNFIKNNYNLSENGFKEYSGSNMYANLQLSYDLDSLNFLTLSLGPGRSIGKTNNNVTAAASGSSTFIQSFTQDFHAESSTNSYDVALNFQHTFRNNKNKVLSLLVRSLSVPDHQITSSNFYDQQNSSFSNGLQNNIDNFHEVSVQGDYSIKLNKAIIETGIKRIERHSNVSLFNSSLPITGVLFSSNFTYHQVIYAPYLSMQKKLKSFSYKIGLRYEQTFNSIHLNTKSNYSNFIPIISVQKSLKNANSLTISYTERLLRPGSNYLNPNIDLSDPRYISLGNPTLVAVVNHIFDLTYSSFKKGFVNASISYSFSNNGVQNVFSNLNDSTIISTYQNIGEKKSITLNSSLNYPITKSISITLNGTLIYVKLKGYVGNELNQHSGFQGFIYTYLTKRFKGGWRLSLNCGYSGSTVLLQGRSNDYFYNSISAGKDFFQGKFILGVSVANPFHTIRSIKTYLQSIDFGYTTYAENYIRNFSLSAFYTFGKLKSTIKKSKKSILNDDKLSL